MPSDRDLLTTLDAIEHLGQDRPGRTHPAVSRTPLYADVQNIGAKSQPDSVTTTCKPMTDVMPEQQVGDLAEVVDGEPASSDDRDAVDEQLIARLLGGPARVSGADRRGRPAGPADQAAGGVRAGGARSPTTSVKPARASSGSARRVSSDPELERALRHAVSTCCTQ